MPSALSPLLSTAIFNIHLIGRSQIWTDVADDRRQLAKIITAKVVTETDFEPLPFDEAIDFFRSKTNLTPAQFAALSQAARVKAFTVAGGASRQVVSSIGNLLDEALSEGLTWQQFQDRAADVLDGAGVSVRTPWYWETVYRTNMQTSYQVGRWKQMTDPDVVAERPFLRYVSARLPTSRPSHVEKHGLVYPVDHSFWQEWYPPNGFNCYCTAMSVSESLLDRRGWKISSRSSWASPDEGFAVNAGIAEAA